MRRIAVALAVILVVATAVPLFAQSAGAVEGVVRDEQGGVLPGVTVSLTGKRGTSSTVTDAAGAYRFSGVDPGTYTVTAELSGFRTKRQENVVVAIGRVVPINLALGVARRPGNRGRGRRVPGGQPGEQRHRQRALPGHALQPAHPARATPPPTSSTTCPASTTARPTARDSDTANGLLLDGVDTRDPEGGSAWTFFNFNIVDEVQVSGLGAPAEYGSFQGAIVNTITKSGGNRYSGLFDAYYTKDSLAGRQHHRRDHDGEPLARRPGQGPASGST